MQSTKNTESALAAFDELNHELLIFMDSVATWFQTNPRLSRGPLPIIHSVKKRIKDREHLREKIERKSSLERIIDGNSLSNEITDLSGVRVLHIHQDQMKLIHNEIMNKVNIKNDWHLNEKPRAYTWDHESNEFFKTLGLDVALKPSSYTSVHYVVRPKPSSNICCEIQVRTLFEEVWGEVDHVLNYPNETSIIACKEQLRVLAKVVGAGTRLVDSIFRSIPASDDAQKSDIETSDIDRFEKTKEQISSVSDMAVAPVQVIAPPVVAPTDQATH
jgi:putative GTP pyrophosphokinase